MSSRLLSWEPQWLAAVGLFFLSGAILHGCSDDASIDGGEEPGAPSAAVAQKAGLDGPPVAVGPFLDGAFPSTTPNDPGSVTWEVVEAFPNVSFNQTLVIVTNPEPGNDRLYVGSRDGNIFSIENDPDTSTAEPFMDLRDRVAAVWDGGFLGLAFHPEFGQAGSPYETTFYTYYSSYCPTTFDGQEYVNDWDNCNPGYPQSSTGGFFNTWLRLSRFQAFWDASAGTWRGDPTSEVPMVNIRLYNGSHRGSGPVFGIDPGGAWEGVMYVAIGDQFRYNTAQDITNNFEGGTIRIEVDITDNGDGTWTCPAGSHLPVRTMQDVTGNADEMTGQQYCIPDDNPWVEFVGPGWSGDDFGEYNTIGHRNPHRIAIDPVTGHMWSGEVGQSTREEINILVPGRNYQWPYMEGFTTGVRSPPATIIGIEQPPVIDFVRTEARAIIGGYVYRGTKFPELYGKYLAGDHVLNNVWAITLDETTMTATKTFLTTFTPGGLATWGQDKAGEVYLGDVFGNDALYELDRVGEVTPDPPALLSDVGAFTDTANFEPSPFWVPYGLNQPFWSDGAEKFRWIALPNDGTRDSASEQVTYSENGLWGYPVGTVLMKHFELVLDEDDPTDRTRLETRFMVLDEDLRWYGVTYRWRPDQTDADLLTTFEVQDYDIALSGGGMRTQTWYFPSRQDCLSCHQQASGGALGLSTRQLNGDLLYPSTGRTDNQISTWNELDMLSPAPDEATLPSLLRTVPLADVTAPLGLRARSWLDQNCGYCHRPGVNPVFDARLTTPFENQGMVLGAVRDDLGVPGLTILTPGEPDRSAIYLRAAAVGPEAMPPLAKALAEAPAVDILHAWITRIESDFGQNGIHYEYYETGDLSVLPDFSTLTPTATGTVNGFDIGIRLRDDRFAFRFTSLLYVGIPGTYTFFTSSDDGSQLFIDGSLVVDNDGLHGVQERSGSVTLSEGYHPIEVTMFERTGGQSLAVNYQGPDSSGQKEAIGVGRLFLQIPSVENEPPTLDDPGDQAGSEGVPSVLNLSGNDPDGDFLYFDADGLPPGLILDHDTGIVSGAPEVGAAGTYNVTASASDASDVAVVTFDWTVSGASGPICGDGTVDAGEECDDGNLANGDGCTSSCTVEFCGDGIVNNGGAEACDDGNTVDGDGCSSTCTIEVSAFCGDGSLDAGEECDDGNTTDGDGCNAACFLEFCGDGVINNVVETCEPPNTDLCNGGCTARTPVCGDDFLTPPEQCEDGNVSDGDGCSSTCTSEIPVACGDGFIDPGEQCDDGNLLDGDGCTMSCAFESGVELTQVGTIIGRQLNPTGGGNPDPEVIRDGDKPPVGTRDSNRQFDTVSADRSPEDWMGYEYTTDLLFGQVVFQEGKNFRDGGFFLDVTVQVRQGGTWVEAPGVMITPAYAVDDGIHFNTYVFDFDPVAGDAIRVYGTPGGEKQFISVGELEVFSAP